MNDWSSDAAKYWCPTEENTEARLEGGSPSDAPPGTPMLDDWVVFAEDLPSLLERQLLVRRRKLDALALIGLVRIGFPV